LTVGKDPVLVAMRKSGMRVELDDKYTRKSLTRPPKTIRYYRITPKLCRMITSWLDVWDSSFFESAGLKEYPTFVTYFSVPVMYGATILRKAGVYWFMMTLFHLGLLPYPLVLLGGGRSKKGELEEQAIKEMVERYDPKNEEVFREYTARISP